ncbi:hypothetical protein D3C76_1415370 [compost metagenome]
MGLRQTPGGAKPADSGVLRRGSNQPTAGDGAGTGFASGPVGVYRGEIADDGFPTGDERVLPPLQQL